MYVFCLIHLTLLHLLVAIFVSSNFPVRKTDGLGYRHGPLLRREELSCIHLIQMFKNENIQIALIVFYFKRHSGSAVQHHCQKGKLNMDICISGKIKSVAIGYFLRFSTSSELSQDLLNIDGIFPLKLFKLHPSNFHPRIQ